MTREDIDGKVRELLAAIMREDDPDGECDIRPDSRVTSDLDLDSVKVVRLFTTLNKQFNGQTFAFQDLVFKDNEFVDFTVADLVDFVDVNLSREG